MSAQVLQFPARRQPDGQPWEAWVDEPAIARHFGVSSRTVRRWRAELGMPSHLIVGARRYRISEAEAWHQTRRQAS